MKKLLSICALILAAGCAHPQATVTPVLNCTPATSGGPYVALNAGTQLDPNTSYLDQPPTGSWCYTIQTIDGSGTSQPSNVVLVTTSTTLTRASLSWTAPTGYTCISSCKYLVSRLAATATIPGAPALSVPTTQAILDIRSPIGLSAHGK